MGYIFNKIITIVCSLYYALFGRFYFKEAGKKCKFERLLHIPQNGGTIILGNHVYFTRFIELTVKRGGKLTFGDGCFIGPGTVFSCHSAISIGDHCLIGEHVSFHDNDHIYQDPDTLIALQGFSSQQISVGTDVWIGCKAIILKGVAIGDHAIIAAGAVVTKDVPDGVIVAGVPARVIRKRLENNAI